MIAVLAPEPRDSPPGALADAGADDAFVADAMLLRKGFADPTRLRILLVLRIG